MRGRITRIFVQAQPGREREVHAELCGGSRRRGRELSSPANFDSTLFAVAVAPESQSEALFSAISALVGFMFALNAMLITVPSAPQADRRRPPAGRDPLDERSRSCCSTRCARRAGLRRSGSRSASCCRSPSSTRRPAIFVRVPGRQRADRDLAEHRARCRRRHGRRGRRGALAAARHPHAAAGSDERPPARGLGSCWVDRAAGRAGSPASRVTTIDPDCAAHRARSLGSVTLVVALVCLLPSLFDGVVIALRALQRPFNGASTILAVTELRTPPTRVRSLAIAATGAVAVFGIVAIQGAQANLQRGLDAVRPRASTPAPTCG